MSKFDKPKALN